jgi:hypothetical protein
MLTSAVSAPLNPIVRSSLALTTCREKPNGFWKVAKVVLELVSGLKSSFCWFSSSSRSSIVIESMIWSQEDVRE